MSQRIIAFLGLGSMGRPMAARLLDAGHRLVVWNRTAERAAPLVARGATLAASPSAAAHDVDVVVLMLTDPSAVERVLLAGDGALVGIRPGALVIDCSTIGPDDARTFSATCAAASARYVDAPVLGSLPQAESGQLVALASGAASAVDEAEPVLRAFAKQVVRAGATGQGSALKLVMNLLVGGLTELLAESITLADRAGVPREAFRETLLGSVLASPFLRYKAPQLFDRRFAPLFSARLMLKDLDLVAHLAKEMGAAIPVTDVVRDVYARTVAAGHGDQDFAAVIEQIATEPAATGR